MEVHLNGKLMPAFGKAVAQMLGRREEGASFSLTKDGFNPEHRHMLAPNVIKPTGVVAAVFGF